MLHFNDGSLTGKDFELVSEPLESDAEAISAYMRQYYSSRGIMPKNILLREMPEDAEALSALFNQLAAARSALRFRSAAKDFALSSVRR